MLPDGQAALNKWYYKYKQNANRDGKSFLLSIDEFKQLTSSNCTYCNASPSMTFKPHAYTNGAYICNGIDRIDNSQGYTINNCVPACTICNYAKNDLTLEQFSEWLQRAARLDRNKKMKSSITPIMLVLNDVYWAVQALENINGWFDNIIVYDAGSNDGTKEGIDSWIAARAHSAVALTSLPLVNSKAQIAYRNAPIAEVLTDYYMLLDGDEIWTARSLQALDDEFSAFVRSDKLYGIVNRVEVCHSLQEAYTAKTFVGHHRIYSKRCTWIGTHPGERAKFPQIPSSEYTFSEKVKVYHMHNTTRSPQEDYALSRMQRKSQKTYHPGSPQPFDILTEIPELKKPVCITHPITNVPYIQPELHSILEKAKV